MAAINLKDRVAALEVEVARLKKKLDEDSRPWTEKIAGAFTNDPAFEEAMRSGREYRESLRPKPKKRRK
jgi:hypothetical protein